MNIFTKTRNSLSQEAIEHKLFRIQPDGLIRIKIFILCLVSFSTFGQSNYKNFWWYAPFNKSIDSNISCELQYSIIKDKRHLRYKEYYNINGKIDSLEDYDDDDQLALTRKYKYTNENIPSGYIEWLYNKDDIEYLYSNSNAKMAENQLDKLPLIIEYKFALPNDSLVVIRKMNSSILDTIYKNLEFAENKPVINFSTDSLGILYRSIVYQYSKLIDILSKSDSLVLLRYEYWTIRGSDSLFRLMQFTYNKNKEIGNLFYINPSGIVVATTNFRNILNNDTIIKIEEFISVYNERSSTVIKRFYYKDKLIRIENDYYDEIGTKILEYTYYNNQELITKEIKYMNRQKSERQTEYLYR